MKPKYKFYTVFLTFFFTLIFCATRAVYASKYNIGTYGFGEYSLTVEDDDSDCDKDSPNGDIKIRSVSAGDTHLKVKFSGMAEPFSKFEIKWGTNKDLAENYLGNEKFGDSNTTSYTIENLVPNTTYYIKVRAVNGCESGDWSDTAHGKTLPVLNTKTVSFNTEVVDYAVVPLETTSSPSAAKIITSPFNTPDYLITVKVVDEGGNVVPDVKVTIGQLAKSTHTDNDGVAKFSNIPQGSYEFLVEGPSVKGSQTVNLEGNVKEIMVTIKLTHSEEPKNKVVLIGLGILAVVLSVALLVRTASRKKNVLFPGA